MEIIKRGTPPAPEDITYGGVCRACGTEVRFKESEACSVVTSGGVEYPEVICPVCPPAKEVKSTRFIRGRKLLPGWLVEGE